MDGGVCLLLCQAHLERGEVLAAVTEDGICSGGPEFHESLVWGRGAGAGRVWVPAGTSSSEVSVLSQRVQ